MSSLHLAIVAHVRAQIMTDGGTYKKYFDGVSDDKVMRTMFASFRGRADTPQGMRLTHIGLAVLEKYFKAHQINMPEGYRLGYADLLWLDARAKMPYYIGRGDSEEGTTRLIVFDSNLGLLLMMADGMISNLREIEFFQPGKAHSD